MPHKKRDKNENCCKGDKMKCHCGCGASSGSIYFFGFVGAAIYYISQSTTFWTGVLGILKAIVWPAFLVYKLLG